MIEFVLITHLKKKMEEIVVVMSPNQADDLDDYTTFEFEPAPHLNETFMSQVGAI